MPIQIQEINENDAGECPLCMEPLEADDINFFPCVCGYQVCRFCWHRIRTDENGLCPACRTSYPEDPAEFKPLTGSDLQKIRNEKRQKEVQRRQKLTDNRRHLAAIRVLQKNLVFVVGLSQRLSDLEVLKQPEYFGKYGKIVKVVINNNTSYAGSQGPSSSAYVTYSKMEEALEAIQSVNNVHVDGRTLKASLGTTKYCSTYVKNQQCHKADCMYLHELAEEEASFTKEEMQAGKHQEVEEKLIEQMMNKKNNSQQETSSVPETTTTVNLDDASSKLSTKVRPTTPTDSWLPPSDKKDIPSVESQSSSENRRKTYDHPVKLDRSESDPYSSRSSSKTGTPTPSLGSSQPQEPINWNENMNPQVNHSPSLPSESMDSSEETKRPESIPSSHDNEAISKVLQNLHLQSVGNSNQTEFTRYSQQNPVRQSNDQMSPSNLLPTSLSQVSWEQQTRTETSLPESIGVSSASHNWETAFGFSHNFLPKDPDVSTDQTSPITSEPPLDTADDDLGFDIWAETNKGLAPLLEKECAANVSSTMNLNTGLKMNPYYSAHDQFYRMPNHVSNGIHGSSSIASPYGPNSTMHQAPLGGTSHNGMAYNKPREIPRNANVLSDWKNGLRALLPNVNINFAMDRQGNSPSDGASSGSLSLSGFNPIPPTSHTSPQAGNMARPMAGGMLGFNQWESTTQRNTSSNLLPSFGNQRTQSAFFQNGTSLNVGSGHDRYSPLAPPPGLGVPNQNSRDPAIISAATKPPMYPMSAQPARSSPHDEAPHWLKSIQNLTDFDSPLNPPSSADTYRPQQVERHLHGAHSSGGWPTFTNTVLPAFSSSSHQQQAPPPGFQARLPYTNSTDFHHSLLENQS